MQENHLDEISLNQKISLLQPLYLHHKGLKTSYNRMKSDSIFISRFIRRNSVLRLEEAELTLYIQSAHPNLDSFLSQISNTKNINSIIIKDFSGMHRLWNGSRTLSNKYKFQNLRSLSVYSSYQSTTKFDSLLKLKKNVRKLELEKFNLELSVYSDTRKPQIREEFYQSFRMFHSITDLKFKFCFQLQKEDSISLAICLNSLRNLKNLSLIFYSELILESKLAFLKTFKKRNPQVFFEFYEDHIIKTFPEFEKYINAMAAVTKLYIKFSYCGEFQYNDIQENKSIQDITWEPAKTGYDNFKVMDVLKINKKLVNLKSMKLNLNNCDNLTFTGFEILPHGDNEIIKLDLALKSTKIPLSGLTIISEQIKRMTKLKDITLSYSDKDLQKEGLMNLFYSIKFLGNLEKLKIDSSVNQFSFFEFAKENSMLKEVDLILSWQIQNIDLLASSLLYTNLKSLKIKAGYKIEKDHLIKLFKAISSQKNLNQLELNFLGCPTLTPAILNDFFANLSYKNFKSLILIFHHINTFKANSSYIFEGLSLNNSLKVLKLELQLYLLENGLKSLIKLLSSQSCLEILSLSIIDHCKTISPEDIIDFSRVLKKFEMMTYLQLSFFKMYHISQEQIHCLFESISELPYLETINLMIIINKNNPRMYSSIISDLLKKYAKNVILNNRNVL